MGKTPENPVMEREVLASNFMTIKTTLDKYGVTYSPVGGLPLRAYLGDPIQKRPNGTVPDFDAQAWGPDLPTINGAIEELKKHKKDPLFPEIGIEPANFSDKPVKCSPLAMLSTMRVDNTGKIYFAYRDIEVEIPQETMALGQIYLNNVLFPCFSARTIYERYFTRSGIIKPKDEGKLARLKKYIDEHEEEQLDEFDYYEPYLRFARLIQEKYPLQVAVSREFWQIDKLLKGNISGASGLVYGMIGFFRK